MDEWDWPCEHRGGPTGQTHNCGCSLGELPVYSCHNPALHRPCVIRTGNYHRTEQAGFHSCANCQFRSDTTISPEPLPHNPTEPYGDRYRFGRVRPGKKSKAALVQLDLGNRTPDGSLTYISTRRLIEDTIKRLLPQVPREISGVAGVPRSGMLPASILATHLQLPLFAAAKDGTILDVGSGSRGRRGWAGDKEGPVLIVDDSVYGGGNMRRQRQLHGDTAIYAAVYVRPEQSAAVDLAATILPSPHLFEWNLFNGAPLIGKTANPVLHGGIALDFDGIICHDDQSGGPIGSPYLLPCRHSVPLILTGRYEKHRDVTEAWLHKHGVHCDRLQMKPDNCKKSYAEYKAEHLAASDCRMMVESCPQQAEQIWRLTGKPVLCPILEKVFQ